MTRELAAYYLSASLREVDYLRANGGLVAVGSGKRVRFRKEDLDRYVGELSSRPAS
ncbi:helix-turn-helix domain-containing protein [Curtobacterium citreum]|uniref:helix-turn-helix domain-containing protein n=1 Tax=Curtobacterium citreum TaxID=2036 RepID=UPI003D6D6171